MTIARLKTFSKSGRFGIIAASLAVLGLAAGLMLWALQDTIVYFKSPSDLATATPGAQRWRVGGLVEPGSVMREGTQLTFRVTDGANAVKVSYKGFIPDLFREGQGVVIEGRLTSFSHFQADTLLARHDENYMPPEVAKALKESGHWKEGAAPAAGGRP